MIDASYFDRKRRELGMDRADTLAQVQALLDEWYPGQARARRLHRGVLRIVTPNASVAGELRMRQVELLATLGDGGQGVRLAVSVGTIT
jgi:hypothetical protein